MMPGQARLTSKLWTVCLLLVCFCLAPISLAESNDAAFAQAAQLYRNQAYKEAMSIFLRLAKGGDVKAQTVLAMMYRYGEGTRVDPETAFKIYQLAAKAGHAPAQFQVGVMLRDGEGIAADVEQALIWFRRAAIQGYDKAEFAIQDLAPGEDATTPLETPIEPRTAPWNFAVPDNLTGANKSDLPLSNTAQFERGFRVQLAAMRTKAAAIDLWNFLNQEFPQLLAGLPYTVSVYQPTPNDAALYRLRAGDFRSEQSARRFCDMIAPVTRRSCWLLSSQENDDDIP